MVVSNYCISISSRNRACLYKVLVSNFFFKVLPKVGMNGSHFFAIDGCDEQLAFVKHAAALRKKADKFSEEFEKSEKKAMP